MTKREEAEDILLDCIPMMSDEDAERFVSLIIDAAKEELRAERAGDTLSASECGDVQGEDE